MTPEQIAKAIIAALFRNDRPQEPKSTKEVLDNIRKDLYGYKYRSEQGATCNEQKG